MACQPELAGVEHCLTCWVGLSAGYLAAVVVADSVAVCGIDMSG